MSEEIISAVHFLADSVLSILSNEIKLKTLYTTKFESHGGLSLIQDNRPLFAWDELTAKLAIDRTKYAEVEQG